MKRTLYLLAGLFVATHLMAADPVKPLRALLVTGGCCHDYNKQKEILTKGISARANVEWTIVHEGGSSLNHRVSIYTNANWANGYDVVVHDECFADVKDTDFVGVILKEHHNGVPAVNLHCAMHSYRTGTNDWFGYLGLQSSRHGPQLPIDISFSEEKHPITQGLTNWTTIKEELYNNLKVWPTAKPLARGKQGKEDTVVVWTHEYGKARIFNTTLGHNNDTVADGRYLDLVTRGLLWTCDKLQADGTPKAGYAAGVSK
jgi:type 1 glutamine amidotransferase